MVFLHAQVALSQTIGESVAARLRSTLFSELLSRNTTFHGRVKTGAMMSWLGTDVEIVGSTLSKLLGARGVRSAFETLGIVVVLFTLSAKLAAALLFSAPLLQPVVAALTSRIKVASSSAQVGPQPCANAVPSRFMACMTASSLSQCCACRLQLRRQVLLQMKY